MGTFSTSPRVARYGGNVIKHNSEIDGDDLLQTHATKSSDAESVDGLAESLSRLKAISSALNKQHRLPVRRRDSDHVTSLITELVELSAAMAAIATIETTSDVSADGEREPGGSADAQGHGDEADTSDFDVSHFGEFEFQTEETFAEEPIDESVDE